MNSYNEILLTSFKQIKNVEEKLLKDRNLTEEKKNNIKEDLEILNNGINDLKLVQSGEVSEDIYINKTNLDQLIKIGNKLKKTLPKYSEERILADNVIKEAYSKVGKLNKKIRHNEKEEILNTRSKLVAEPERKSYFEIIGNKKYPMHYMEELDMDKEIIKERKEKIKKLVPESKDVINKVDLFVFDAMEYKEKENPGILKKYIYALKTGKKEDIPFDLEYNLKDMSRLSLREKAYYLKTAWNNRKVATVKWPKNKFKSIVAGVMAVGIAMGGIGYAIKDKVKDFINNKNEITYEYTPSSTLNIKDNKNEVVMKENNNKSEEEIKNIEEIKEAICIGDTVNLENGVEYFASVEKGADKGVIGETEYMQAGEYTIDGVAVTYGDEILNSIYQDNLGMSIDEYKEKIAKENGINVEDLNVHVHIGGAGWTQKSEKDLEVTQKYNKDNKFKESLQCDINQTPSQDDVSKQSVSSIGLER